MNEKPLRPKLELPTNIPVHVEIKYPPYNGEGKDYGYGMTYKYTVIHGEAEKIWFVSDRVYPQVQDFKKGDKIVILKREEKRDGETYTKIEVHPEFFDEGGRLSTGSDPPKPALDTPDGIESYRKKVKNTLYMAVDDVIAVKLLFAQRWEDVKEADRIFTPDIIQKYATSILIDYLKRT